MQWSYRSLALSHRYDRCSCRLVAVTPAKYQYVSNHLDRSNESCWHIEAKTKWPPFRSRQFHVHFPEWNLWNFKWNFPEICSLWSNWQYGNIGSDYGWLPNRWQAIIWTIVGMFYWGIYICITRPQSVKGLTHCGLLPTHAAMDLCQYCSGNGLLPDGT